MKNHLINPIYRVDVRTASRHMDTELFYTEEEAVAYVKSWREDLEVHSNLLPENGVEIKITLEEVISYQTVK
jgi:hypothetical protein